MGVEGIEPSISTLYFALANIYAVRILVGAEGIEPSTSTL